MGRVFGVVGVNGGAMLCWFDVWFVKVGRVVCYVWWSHVLAWRWRNLVGCGLKLGGV